MKKLIGCILAISMTMAVVACGSAENIAQTEPAPAAEVKPEATPAPEIKESETTETTNEEVVVAEEATRESKEEETAEGTDKDDLFILNGTNYKGERFKRDLIEEYAEYDSLKVFVVDYNSVLVDILSDGESFEVTKESGGCYFFFYAPQKVSKQKNIGGDGCLYTDEHIFDEKVTATCYFDVTKTGKDVPFGIEVTYEDGTEESITIYVTKEY